MTLTFGIIFLALPALFAALYASTRGYALFAVFVSTFVAVAVLHSMNLEGLAVLPVLVVLFLPARRSAGQPV